MSGLGREGSTGADGDGRPPFPAGPAGPAVCSWCGELPAESDPLIRGLHQRCGVARGKWVSAQVWAGGGVFDPHPRGATGGSVEVEVPVGPPRPGRSTAAGSEVVEQNLVASLRRRLLHGSTWLSVGRVGGVVLGVGINALLARLLTHAEFGAYFTSYTLMFVGGLIAQLGLDRAVVRLVSAAVGTGRAGRARQAIRVVLGVGSVASVVLTVILTFGLGPWFAGHVLHSDLIASALPLVAAWLLVAAIQSLFVETFRGLQRFDQATLFDAILVDVLLAMTFGLLYTFRAHITLGVAIGLTVGFTALITLLGGIFLRRQVVQLNGPGTASRAEVMSIAWPSLFSNLAAYLVGSGVDLLVLGHFRPQQVVGLYAAASRLGMLVANPLMIVGGVLPPLVAELYARGRMRELERAVRVGATLAGVPAFVMLLAFVIFGRQVMAGLYGPYYAAGASILAILSAARMFGVWAGSCGITLIMTGHQKAMMYTTIISAAVSVTGDIVAAMYFGPVGVAVATGTAIVLQNAMQLLLARRLVGVWTQVDLRPRALMGFVSGRAL